MAILINTTVKGQTEEGYDQVSVMLHELVKKAPGFILHSAYSADGEFHVMEIWNSKKEADDFFAKMVAPNLPAGIISKLSYRELHSVVVPGLKAEVA